MPLAVPTYCTTAAAVGKEQLCVACGVACSTSSPICTGKETSYNAQSECQKCGTNCGGYPADQLSCQSGKKCNDVWGHSGGMHCFAHDPVRRFLKVLMQCPMRRLRICYFWSPARWTNKLRSQVQLLYYATSQTQKTPALCGVLCVACLGSAQSGNSQQTTYQDQGQGKGGKGGNTPYITPIPGPSGCVPGATTASCQKAAGNTFQTAGGQVQSAVDRAGGRHALLFLNTTSSSTCR